MPAKTPCLALALSLLVATSVAAQEGGAGAEIIRGRVFGPPPDSQPLLGAIVTVTGVRSELSHTTRTNAQGLYTVLFPDPEGDYLVTVRYPGFAPQTARVTTQGEARLLVLDFALSLLPHQLDPVTVIADPQRPRPGRADGRSVGGNEQNALGGKLFSLDPSDLNTLAASVPGILLIPGADGRTGGFSVLGLPSEQNAVTVDGSTFDGATLPQDAIARAAVRTTTYDPAQGQFSGGQLAIGTRGGTNRFSANVRSSLMHPSLAWADPAAPRPLAQDAVLGGSAGGPIRRGTAYYFASIETRRTENDLFSLLGPHDVVLEQRGLARDTVAALVAALDRLGVPLTTGAIPDAQLGTRTSAFVRLDARRATKSISLRADGNWNRSDGAGISALTFPAQGSGTRSENLGLQFTATTYVGGFLSQWRSHLQRSYTDGAPYVPLPRGDVRVGTTFPDGRAGLASLPFGGGNAGTARRATRSWETNHEVSWMSLDSRHRVKFGQQIAVSRAESREVADPYGRLSYASLADLEVNRPASYARTLGVRERATNAVTGALWLGDEWRPSPRLRLELGLRAEIARAGPRPAYNAAVDSAFGLRTDRVPRDVGFSPRLGFSWMLREAPRSALPQPGRWLGGAIRFSGGVGVFRGVIAPAQIAALGDATGLPNTVRQLQCVGDATPIPDWPGYAADPSAIPDECLDGSAPAEFSDDRPRVAVYDPRFRAATSWRGNLKLDGLSVLGWPVSVQATHQRGSNGESQIDENLRRAPVTVLPEERGRPLFVAPASIVPATGAVAPAAARVSDQFGPVIRHVSDLRNVATQVSFSLAPPRPLFGALPLDLSYTFTHNRAQERGFRGSTAGDPFAREWAAGPHPAHQVGVRTSFNLKWLSIGLQANVVSGAPYTPMVAGDVNGDGMANDRAFVFDPAATADPELAAQMAALLRSAPEGARECLRAQLGAIAARNSCGSGWRVQPEASINLRLPSVPNERGVGLLDRMTLSIRADNLLGALLRLAHIRVPASVGWGRNVGAPDPTLLHVEGFDPATQRFRYRVNQQFGSTEDRSRGGRNDLGVGAFRLQLGAELRLGGPSQRSMAERFGLVPRRGEPALTVPRAKDRLRGQVSNPLERLLARADTLALTGPQRAEIERISGEFQARVDTALTPLAEYVVREGRRLRDGELQRRLSALLPEMRELMLAALHRGLVVLTAQQQARVPELVRLAERGPRREMRD